LIFLAFVIGVSKAYGHKIGAALDKLADTENKSYSAGLENASKGSFRIYDDKVNPFSRHKKFHLTSLT
jgi:hypothetical protein